MAAVALAACGGGSKSKSSRTQTALTGTGTVTLAPTGPSTTGGATSTSETSTHGGGSEPVRAPAMLTGRGGRIAPTSVQVPPFIAVQISLASGDGRPYTLSVAGHTLLVSGSHPNATVTLPGIRPGASYTATAGGQKITITPSAEPGP